MRRAPRAVAGLATAVLALCVPAGVPSRTGVQSPAGVDVATPVNWPIEDPPEPESPQPPRPVSPGCPVCWT
jgi:hypothetical protein